MESIRGDKIPFDGLLCGLFQLCVLIGCIPGHRTLVKAILLGFLGWISYYLITKTTTGDLAVDVALGSAILTQFLIALDSMFFTDPDTLKDYHDPHPGKISEQSLLQRIRWAFNLYTNSRGIGWDHEPHNLPKRPSPTTTRRNFVLVRLITAILCALLECAAYNVNASNPGMTTPGRILSESPIVWRALGVAGFAVAGAARINSMNCVLSAGVVGVGLSQPDRWPNMFGSLLEAWSVQRVWRRVWHQLMRKPLLGSAHIILTKTLGLSPLSHKSSRVNKILWLFTIFTIVGVVHIGGEYMLLGKMGYGAFNFFILQAVGITIEKLISLVWIRIGPRQIHPSSANGKGANGVYPISKSADRKPRIWAQCLGYVWVAVWFSWSLAFMVDPMVASGMFVDPRHDWRKNGWISQK